MARRKKRKSKRGRKKKKPAIFKFIRGIFAVVILSGSFIVLYLLLNQASSFISSGEFLGFGKVDELVSVELAKGENNRQSSGSPKKALGDVGELQIQIGLLSDSEGDIESLERAIAGLKDFGVGQAFFLGDLTRYGSVGELEEVKNILDNSGIEFLVIPGDHDLADSVDGGDSEGRGNFRQVFGKTMHIYENNGYKFMLFDNSANFTKISEEDLSWFKENLGDVDFVILSQPLYHPTNQRVMGKHEGEVVSTVRFQAEEMLEKTRDSDVKAIIAADQHFHSVNQDPEKEGLAHIVIGALVSNKDSLRNPQSSRYAILKIYEKGDYVVEEVVL
jgi:predicted phosphodiesterase